MLTARHFMLALLLPAPAFAQTVLVKPYVQHGEQAAVGEADSKVIAFTTDNTPGTFEVEFTAPGAPARRVAARPTLVQAAAGKESKNAPATKPAKSDADAPAKPDPEAAPTTVAASPTTQMLNYRADLKNLPLSSTITYRVLQTAPVEREIVSAHFPTRRPATEPVSFLVFGDNARGKPEQRKIAFQMSMQPHEFILNVGDNVYTEGRISQYTKQFWPDYCNTDEASPEKGAPLMRYAPYYLTFGNHDTDGGDLKKTPDGMAGFLFFYHPLNGPVTPFKLPLSGPADRVEWFKAAAGERYPRMLNYAFDNGPCHFLVLDANKWVDANDKALRDWVAADLAATKLPWKFVAFHQPAFALSSDHGIEQRMRGLCPLFEAGGVSIVFTGHVHNYQRSHPLKFTPTLDAKGNVKVSKDGLTTGATLIDTNFDGTKVTKPDGILHLVTGAGGGGLHDEKVTESPELWPKITAKYVSDKNSFTVVNASPTRVEVKQLDEKGAVIDAFTVTK